MPITHHSPGRFVGSIGFDPSGYRMVRLPAFALAGIEPATIPRRPVASLPTEIQGYMSRRRQEVNRRLEKKEGERMRVDFTTIPLYQIFGGFQLFYQISTI